MLFKFSFIISITSAATIASIKTQLSSHKTYVSKSTTIDIDDSLLDIWHRLATTTAPSQTASYLSYIGSVYSHSFDDICEVETFKPTSSIPNHGNPGGVRCIQSGSGVASTTTSGSKTVYSVSNSKSSNGVASTAPFGASFAFSVSSSNSLNGASTAASGAESESTGSKFGLEITTTNTTGSTPRDSTLLTFSAGGREIKISAPVAGAVGTLIVIFFLCVPKKIKHEIFALLWDVIKCKWLI